MIPKTRRTPPRQRFGDQRSCPPIRPAETIDEEVAPVAEVLPSGSPKPRTSMFRPRWRGQKEARRDDRHHSPSETPTTRPAESTALETRTPCRRSNRLGVEAGAHQSSSDRFHVDPDQRQRHDRPGSETDRDAVRATLWRRSLAARARVVRAADAHRAVGRSPIDLTLHWSRDIGLPIGMAVAIGSATRVSVPVCM